MVFEKAGIRGTGIWTKGQGEKHGSHAGKERWQLMQTGASMEIHGHPQNVKQLFSRPETWKYHSSLPNDRSSMDWESIETCHWVPRRFAKVPPKYKNKCPQGLMPPREGQWYPLTWNYELFHYSYHLMGVIFDKCNSQLYIYFFHKSTCMLFQMRNARNRNMPSDIVMS